MVFDWQITFSKNYILPISYNSIGEIGFSALYSAEKTDIIC
jgi:hypothetical protein